MSIQQHQRLIKIHQILSEGRFPSIKALTLELKVSRRQISYDRKSLLGMGAPLYYDRQRGGWGYRDPSWFLPAISLSEGELLSFFFAVMLASSLGDTELARQLMSGINKIAQHLGDEVSLDLQSLQAATSFGLSPSFQAEAQTCDLLRSAHLSRQKVHIHYFTASRGELNQRTVHPYHLYFTRGDWILIAFDEKSSAIRCFNIARIKEPRALKQSFTLDPTFDAQEFTRTMLWAEAGDVTYQVVVRFDPYQARYMRERHWHLDEKSENLPDGSYQLSFPASGLQEVARWALGYGKHAEVLEPPELRAIMKSHIAEMHRIYEEDSQ